MNKFETELVEQIPSLRRYSRALTANVYEADDLVQDVLERALRKKSLWHRGHRLRPWLFAIMHNTFVNKVVRQSKQAALQLVSEPVSDTTSDAESLWKKKQLQQAISQLPADQRQVFLMVSLEGFAYKEVANIMETPVGTVMSRLSRARNRLRQLIQPTNSIAEGQK